MAGLDGKKWRLIHQTWSKTYLVLQTPSQLFPILKSICIFTCTLIPSDIDLHSNLPIDLCHDTLILLYLVDRGWFAAGISSCADWELLTSSLSHKADFCISFILGLTSMRCRERSGIILNCDRVCNKAIIACYQHCKLQQWNTNIDHTAKIFTTFLWEKPCSISCSVWWSSSFFNVLQSGMAA